MLAAAIFLREKGDKIQIWTRSNNPNTPAMKAIVQRVCDPQEGVVPALRGIHPDFAVHHEQLNEGRQIAQQDRRPRHH